MKFGLNFFHGRQRAFEFLGELHKMGELGDAHRGCGAAKRVFNDNLGLRLAENQADARLIVRVTERTVDMRVKLAGVLRGVDFNKDDGTLADVVR